jgi:hypothetical protein
MSSAIDRNGLREASGVGIMDSDFFSSVRRSADS